MSVVPPSHSGNTGAAPLDELRRRHWVAYLALRERLRLAAPEDLPGLHEQLARLEEHQQAEEMALARTPFLRGDLPPAAPTTTDTNQEI